jgi:osmotically-inducible protein OsmY
VSNNPALLDAIRQALRSESRVRFTQNPLHLVLENDDLVMEGEVADVAAKKLALEKAASVPGLHGIVDRIRVRPAERMADGQVRDLLRNSLLEDSAFSECAIRVRVKDQWKTCRAPAPAAGSIDIEVADGVVTLAGDVPGLGLKRLAGLLAWWVPGSRDVVNGLGVTPPEEDNDDEIIDAVRLALEKDPFVNPDQIRVTSKNAVVTLQGLVPTASEREMAEFDAWYVFGVDRVVNEIRMRP